MHPFQIFSSLRFQPIAAVVFCVGTSLLLNQAEAVTLNATDDNNTLKSSPTTVQPAGSITLASKTASSTQTNSRTVYVKFSLSGLISSDYDSATFSILTAAATAAGSNSFTFRLFALNAGDVDYDWTESALTWDTSPALGGSGTNYVDTAKATALGSTFSVAGGTAAGTQFSVPVTGWDTFRQVDDTITFILVTTAQQNGSNSLSWASSENTTYTGPSLTLVPEPAAGGFLILGIGAIAGRRWRSKAAVQG